MDYTAFLKSILSKILVRKSRWYFHPCKDEKGRIYLYKETEVYQLENGSLKLIPELSNLNAGFTACLYLFWSNKLKKLICSQRGGIWIYDPELGNVERSAGLMEILKHFMSCQLTKINKVIYGVDLIKD
ncbi:MAG: hypothetical protein IPL42_02040 [Saprospiraceae bacterium]|nr:hypothetical protein [Saprospiraceae bacterium]